MPEINEELFQAVIDDHWRRPRNRAAVPSANRVVSRENPFCGDVCRLYLNIRDGRVVAMGFTGAGCALSQASASLAASALEGMEVGVARGLVQAVRVAVETGQSSVVLGDLAGLALVHAKPARRACALLAWEAAEVALAENPETSD